MMTKINTTPRILFATAILAGAISAPATAQPSDQTDGKPQVFNFGDSGSAGQGNSGGAQPEDANDDPGSKLTGQTKALYEKMVNAARAGQSNGSADGLPEPSAVAQQAEADASGSSRSRGPQDRYAGNPARPMPYGNSRQGGDQNNEADIANLRQQMRSLQQQLNARQSQQAQQGYSGQSDLSGVQSQISSVQEALADAETARHSLANNMNQSENARLNYEKRLRQAIMQTQKQVKAQQGLLGQLASQMDKLLDKSSPASGDDLKNAKQTVSALKKQVDGLDKKTDEIMKSDSDLQDKQADLAKRMDGMTGDVADLKKTTSQLAVSDDKLHVGQKNLVTYTQLVQGHTDHQISQIAHQVHQTYSLALASDNKHQLAFAAGPADLHLQRVAGVYQKPKAEQEETIGQYLVSDMSHYADLTPLIGHLNEVPFASSIQ